MIIIIIIILLILIFEVLTYFSVNNNNLDIKIEEISKNTIKKIKEVKISKNFEKEMLPGIIYTPESCNLFIKINNNVKLIEKNKVYKIINKFILEYINIDKEDSYFYAENN